MHPLVLCALALIAGPLGSPFELEVDPAQPLVEHGGSVLLRLRSSCTDPEGSGNVETSLRKRLLPAPPGQRLLQLLNVTQWNCSLWAYYSCWQQRKVLPIKLLVYRPLEQPVLEPVPVLAVGQSQELACVLRDVAPLRRLKVRMRLGNSLVLSTHFQEREQDEPGTVRVVQALRVRREHHGANVSCEAELDLGPQGPRFSAVAEPRQIQVYEFPADPDLDPHVFLEPGERLPVSCGVGDVFPAPRFRLALGNRSLAVSVSADGRRATAELSREQPGEMELVCAVSVGPMERRREAAVHVFWFPSPLLEVPLSVPLGSRVGGSCSLPPGHFPPQLRLRLRSGSSILRDWAPAPLLFPVPARAEDHGRELLCEAQVPGSARAPKGSAVSINVTAPPSFDDRSCPPQQNWTEGRAETLLCRARGHPPPLLECVREGAPFPAGEPLLASRRHAGTYSCSATNRLGAALRHVRVSVSYPDPDPDPDLVLLLLVPVLAVTALLGAGLGYGVYYRKKKMRRYRLRQRQRQQPAPVPLGCSKEEEEEEEAAPVLNGSTRETRP